MVISTFFIATGLYAGKDVKDVIKLEDKAYEKHTKGIVTFSHKKHMKEYAEKNPELYKNGCGECHHADKDGKAVPLKNLKEGDDVNVAARLEGLAEPRGVCISDIVHQTVLDRVGESFRDMGGQEVKTMEFEITRR